MEDPTTETLGGDPQDEDSAGEDVGKIPFVYITFPVFSGSSMESGPWVLL